jgi:hypothetical protein
VAEPSIGDQSEAFQTAMVAALRLVSWLTDNCGAEILNFELDSAEGAFSLRIPVRWEPGSRVLPEISEAAEEP